MLYVNGQKMLLSSGGGHSIKNDSGAALAQKNNLKFSGTYSTNVGDDSVVNVTRSMTAQEYALLSADEKKGFINVTDESGNNVTADDIAYDNTSSGLTGDTVQEAIDEVGGKISGIELGTNLEFEVGQFSITYNSKTGNITGVKVTSKGNNRYTIIGSEIAGGTIGMGTYVYNSWSNDTIRVGYKTADVTVSANAQGVAALDSSFTNKHILSIYSPPNQYICLPFSSPNASGYGWYAKIFKFYDFTPLEANDISLRIVYTD